MRDQPKWSPAPWRRWKIQLDPPQHISDGDIIVSNPARHVVAMIARHEGESQEQLNANADLIAAAPEIYESLEEFCEALTGADYQYLSARPSILKRAHAALAKARGESQ